MPNNANLIRKAAITSESVGSGLLSPEQARTFLRQSFEATPLGPLVRHELRMAKNGEINKIGIARRILRKKVEDLDAASDGAAPTIDPVTGQITGYRALPRFSQIEYTTTAVRLPWEITEDTLRENIEGESFESIVTDMMTSQLGVDLEDIYLNGDTATPAADPDHDFLYINDGWIKQIAGGGHVVDVQSGPMDLDVYYRALTAMPNKYNNGKLRWLMSPHRRQAWELYILKKAVENGGIITDKRVESPVSVPVIEVPAMPDDIILLTDPQNLIVVNSYGIIIRKTIEGREAIMADKRFYVVHLDFDPIIEELDATAILTNLPAVFA